MKAAKTIKAKETMPSPEWLSEMAILLSGPDLLGRDRDRPLRAVELVNLRETLLAKMRSAVEFAHEFYRISQGHLRWEQERDSPVVLPSGLSKTDLKKGRVSFQKGCRLITGQKKTSRAIQNYLGWEEWRQGAEDNFGPVYGENDGFSTTEVADFSKHYKKTWKKALDAKRRHESLKRGQGSTQIGNTHSTRRRRRP